MKCLLRITVAVIPNSPRNFKYQKSTIDMPTNPKSDGESNRTTTSKAAQETAWLDQFARARHARLEASDPGFQRPGHRPGLVGTPGVSVGFELFN